MQSLKMMRSAESLMKHMPGHHGGHKEESIASSDESPKETIEDLETLILTELGNNCWTLVVSVIFVVLSGIAVIHGIAACKISYFHQWFLATSILFVVTTLFQHVQYWRIVVYSHSRDHTDHPPACSEFARHDRTWWFIMGVAGIVAMAAAIFGLIYEFEEDVKDKKSYKMFLVIAYIFSIVAVSNLAMVLQDRFERHLWEDIIETGGHHAVVAQHEAEHSHTVNTTKGGSWHLPSLHSIKSQPRSEFHGGKEDEEFIAHTLSNALSTMHDTIGCWPAFFALTALVSFVLLGIAVWKLKTLYLMTVMFGACLVVAGTFQLTKVCEDNDDRDDNNHLCIAVLVLCGGVIALVVAISICPTMTMPLENKLTCGLGLLVCAVCIFCCTRMYNRKKRLEVLKEHHTDEFGHHTNEAIGHKRSFFGSILSKGSSAMHLPSHWHSHSSKPVRPR